MPPHSHSILQSFVRDTFFQSTLWFEKRIRNKKTKKHCPFSKCPMEKNKKRHYSIIPYSPTEARQWSYDGLKPSLYIATSIYIYDSMETRTGPSGLCMRRATSTARGLNHTKAFLFLNNEGGQRNVAKLHFICPLMPMWQCSSEFPIITTTWLHHTELWGQSTEGSSLEIIPYQYDFIKWKQLLLAKTILINVQLRRAQKTILFFVVLVFFLTNFFPLHNLHKSALKCH